MNCLAFQTLPYDERTHFSSGWFLCSWHTGSSEVGVYFWLLSSLWEQQSVVLSSGSLTQLPAGTTFVSSICQALLGLLVALYKYLVYDLQQLGDGHSSKAL